MKAAAGRGGRGAIRFVGGRYPSFAKGNVGASAPITPPPPCCQPHVIHSHRAVFPHHRGGPQSGAVCISSTGRIDAIHPSATLNEAKRLATKLNRPLTALGEDIALSPGLIDVHCHISELGRDWEGYRTATRAAAAGGITTLMGMPLNSLPATTTVEALEQEVEAACEVHLMADVGLWGGAVPSNTSCEEGLRELERLLDAGVFGLKAFLAPLPKDAGYETVSPAQLEQAAEVCGRRNKPLLVHSELMTQEEQDTKADEAYDGMDDGSYEAHVASRPGQWERDAVEVVCNLTNRCHMHVVHLSDAGCLDVIESTKRRLMNADADIRGNLTVETCPHYLLFDLESLPDADTHFKCFPPIREKANQMKLWNRGLLDTNTDGFPLIDMIASDHSPCTPEMRLMESENVRRAWGGLSGLQYQLQSSITALERYQQSTSRGVADEMIAQLAQWWSTAPSKLVPGLHSIKGSIAVGCQADLCAWDTTFLGEPNGYGTEHHRWRGGSVYAEMELRGRVVETWLRGVKVYDGESDSFLDESNGAGSIMLH
ncbi:hypothetical protein ACHAXT_010852 [Thalassiosira profunda]